MLALHKLWKILSLPNRQVKFNYSSKFLLWIPKVFDSFVIFICFSVIAQVGMDTSDNQVFINPRYLIVSNMKTIPQTAEYM